MFVKAGFLGITKIPWLVFGLAYDRILVGFSVELRNFYHTIDFYEMADF